jgi:hypothetical protein
MDPEKKNSKHKVKMTFLILSVSVARCLQTVGITRDTFDIVLPFEMSHLVLSIFFFA